MGGGVKDWFGKIEGKSYEDGRLLIPYGRNFPSFEDSKKGIIKEVLGAKHNLTRCRVLKRDFRKAILERSVRMSNRSNDSKIRKVTPYARIPELKDFYAGGGKASDNIIEAELKKKM